jgi:hypothetical protein
VEIYEFAMDRHIPLSGAASKEPPELFALELAGLTIGFPQRDDPRTTL